MGLGHHISGWTTIKEDFQYFKDNDYYPECVQFSLQHQIEASRSSRELTKRMVDHSIKIYYHTSFTVNLCRPELRAMSLNILRRASLVAQSYNCSGVVTHLGYRKRKEEEGVSVEEAQENLLIILGQTRSYFTGNMFLLLENCPGSKDGAMFGSLKEFSQIREDLPHNVGFCLDTCHAYVNGESFLPWFCSDSEKVKLIHLNGMDSGEGFGLHKDRHSFSSFSEQKDLNFLKDILFLRDSSVDLIIERKGNAVILKDINYLRRS